MWDFVSLFSGKRWVCFWLYKYSSDKLSKAWFYYLWSKLVYQGGCIAPKSTHAFIIQDCLRSVRHHLHLWELHFPEPASLYGYWIRLPYERNSGLLKGWSKGEAVIPGERQSSSRILATSRGPPSLLQQTAQFVGATQKPQKCSCFQAYSWGPLVQFFRQKHFALLLWPLVAAPQTIAGKFPWILLPKQFQSHVKTYSAFMDSVFCFPDWIQIDAGL